MSKLAAVVIPWQGRDKARRLARYEIISQAPMPGRNGYYIFVMKVPNGVDLNDTNSLFSVDLKAEPVREQPQELQEPVAILQGKDDCGRTFHIGVLRQPLVTV